MDRINVREFFSAVFVGRRSGRRCGGKGGMIGFVGGYAVYYRLFRKG